MNTLRTLRNYILYCGIEKNEYNAVKKEAYIANFGVWLTLHVMMLSVFGILFVFSLFSDLFKINTLFYLVALIYYGAATALFFILKKDSIAGQLIIYLSISFLFLFGCFITQNKPTVPATLFFVLLLITPMFIIDKPIFMSLELIIASTVFCFWMYHVKPYDIWQYDFINAVIYTIVGIFLHIITNSIRIREFVLTRKINIQKDTDELTGLKNKGALTREINEFLTDDTTDKGTLLILDIDDFKLVNDTYGHDIGDSVIQQLGSFLNDSFHRDEIIGRFGGDEFIVFIKHSDDLDTARRAAEDIITGASNRIVLPDEDERINISIGIATYDGHETNYSEIFKKADTALYKAKADPVNRFYVYE